MSIDINQFNTNQPDAPKRQKGEALVTNSAPPAENKAASTPPQSANANDNVSLSNTAQSLSKIEAELKSSPEVDQNKVNEIKSRIANGDYQINPQNMAQKLLNIEV